MQGVDLFITITDRSRAEQFAAWFRTHGISLVLTVGLFALLGERVRRLLDPASVHE